MWTKSGAVKPTPEGFDQCYLDAEGPHTRADGPGVQRRIDEAAKRWGWKLTREIPQIEHVWARYERI